MGQFEKYLGKKLDGRYELREIIGIGGMAVVYAAYDLQTQEMVAVKLLKDEYLANDEFRRRFKTESKAISVLSHPNIVNVHDVCLGDRLQYIVMELVDGITLKEYLELKHVLPWRDSLYFLSQILSALAHAHEKGIIHRDIKPQNILLMQSGLIKVTDFGIARFARSNSNSDTMTNRAIGSVHYISPEQARGDQVDARADIYSVGVMLYEMLTGKLPFTADTAVQVAVMQMQAEPVPPRRLNPDIPEGLEDIVLKAMQKKPENRYQSAAEMLAAVEELKRNPSISFAYKYFDDSTPQHVADAFDSTRSESRAEKREALINLIKKDNGKKTPAKAASKPDDGKPTRYKSRWLGILCGVTIASVVATALFVVLAVWLRTTLLTPSGAEVDLPNLVGLTIDQINADDAYQKFEIEVDTENSTYNNNYPTNTVYEQTPVPPKKVKEGSKITIKVSLGPELIAIPDLSTREKSAAVAAIENLGLFPKTVERFSTDVAAGYVISTEPAAGTEVSPGSTVTLYISQNDSAKAVEVPYSLVDATVNEAQRYLVELGLVPGSVITQASSAKADTVIGSNPAPGTLVVAGSTVDIIISDGSFYVDTTVTMPVFLNNLPQRSFRYLIEVYADANAAPIYTGVVEAGAKSLTMNIEVGDGTATLKVRANGQLLREITVNYDDRSYAQRGIDYAIDLSPGYVADDYEPPVSSAPTVSSSPIVSETSSASGGSTGSIDLGSGVYESNPLLASSAASR